MTRQLPDPAHPQTILHAIAHHAQHSPERLACKFLREGAEPQALTYGELQQRVDAVAERLQAIAQPGERALLLYPQGLKKLEAIADRGLETVRQLLDAKNATRVDLLQAKI